MGILLRSICLPTAPRTRHALLNRWLELPKLRRQWFVLRWLRVPLFPGCVGDLRACFWRLGIADLL